MGLPGKPAASAPARSGSPAPIASGLSRPTPPNPPRQLPIQSPAATPPRAQSLFFRIKRQATSHLRKKESCAYDLFQGIDELDDRFHENCHKRGIHLSSQTPISAVGGLETKDEKEWQRGGGRLKCRLEMRTSRTGGR